jgi:hypothetical protein
MLPNQKSPHSKLSASVTGCVQEKKQIPLVVSGAVIQFNRKQKVRDHPPSLLKVNGDDKDSSNINKYYYGKKQQMYQNYFNNDTIYEDDNNVKTTCPCVNFGIKRFRKRINIRAR